MQTGRTTRNAQEVEREAASWIIRNEDPGQPPEERALFESWLAADARHRAAYIRLNQAWRKTSAHYSRMRPYEGAVDPDLLLRDAAPARQDRAPLRWKVAAIAAVATLVAGIGSWIFATYTGWESAAAAFGGREQLQLADGTTVNLNTDSEARMQLTVRKRAVIVLRGEAHFHVARDARRPFEVQANGAIVRATGTAFNVRVHGAHRLDVLVDEGAVAISLRAGRGGPMHTVRAGYSATIHRQHIEVRRLASHDVARKLAWLQGRIWLDGETLAEAAAEFNRYNHTRLTIADPTIAAWPIEGIFDQTRLDAFVAAVMRSYPGIRAERLQPKDASPGEIRLLTRAPKPAKRD